MSLPYYEYRISPQDHAQGPFDGGVSGDHAAARVVFEALDAAYTYRVEAVTGAGEFDTTETHPAEDGEWGVDIPAAWTAAGVLQLRLVQVKQGENGEEQRRYFPPVLLKFAYRDEGNAALTAAPAWQELYARAEQLLAKGDEAAAAAVAAKTAAEECLAHGEAVIDEALQAAVSAQSVAEHFAAQCDAVLSQVEALSGLTASIRQVVGV